MKIMFFIFLLGCLPVAAENYMEIVCSRNSMEFPKASVCQPVKDKEAAIQRVAEFATNTFKGVQWVAVMHSKGDGENIWHIDQISNSIAPSKVDMTKYVLLFELVSSNTFGVTYCLPAQDKAAADKIEASVKAEYPAKTFMVDEKTSLAAPK